MYLQFYNSIMITLSIAEPFTKRLAHIYVQFISVIRQ